MGEAWMWWAGAALVLVTLELVGGEFVLLMLGLSCLAGAVTAFFTDNVVAQVVVSAASAVVLLLLVRPYLRRRVMAKVPHVPMGADTYIGQEGLVLEAVTDRSGQVRLDEGTWTARPAVQGSTYDAGQLVRVVAIDGATALVTGADTANKESF